MILDTNGNGRRDEGYAEPDQPVDPAKDKRIIAGFTASDIIRMTARSGARCFRCRAGSIRIIPGENPPATTLAEILRGPVQ